MRRVLPTLSFVFLLYSSFAVNRTSTGSGNWNTAGTWSPAGVPTAADNITILGGHTIIMNNNNMSCLSLTVSGRALWAANNTLNIGTGGLITNNGANLAAIFGPGGTINCAGAWTVNAGTTTVGRKTINITGLTTLNGTISLTSNSGNKNFTNMQINNGGGVNMGAQSETFNIAGNLSMFGGTLTATTGIPVYIIGGTFTAANLNTWGPGSYTVTGSSTITGTLTVNSTTGTKSIGDLTINGTLNNTVAESWNISGNLINNGTFTSNTGTYTLTGANKTISGTANTSFSGPLSVSGSYTNNGTVTILDRISGAGSFIQGTTGMLNYNAATTNFTVAIFTASAAGNTVNYGFAGNQTVRNPTGSTYHHFMISGSGTKSLSASHNINGDVTITGGTFDVTASNFNLTVFGNWLNTLGTFNPRAATVTFSGGNQTITKVTGETFFVLVIGGTLTKTLGGPITVNSNLNINATSTLDVGAGNNAITLKRNFTNNGGFIARNGLITLSGTVPQVLGGTSITTFYNIMMSNSTGASITQPDSLKGSLDFTAGTFACGANILTLVSDATRTARIGNIVAGSDFTGSITMQRLLAGGPTDWRMPGNCITGQTLLSCWDDDITTSGYPGSDYPSFSFCSVYHYDEPTPGDKDFGYIPPVSALDAMPAGRGYYVYVGPTPVMFDATGVPYKNNQTVSLSYTNNDLPINVGWNLVSNVYPSSVDWDAAGWTKVSLNNAIYVWNAALQQYASYVASIGTNGGTQYIPSSQSFWVQAFAGGPSLTFRESVKSAQDPVYFRVINPLVDNPLLKFKLTDGIFSDETVINFNAEAGFGFDGMFDAYKLKGAPTVPCLSTLDNDLNDYAINSMPLPESDVKIPVRVIVPVSGTYTLILDSSSRLPDKSCVILEDLVTGALIDLHDNSVYSFTQPDTAKVPRFFVHFREPVGKPGAINNCYFSPGTYSSVSETSALVVYARTVSDEQGVFISYEMGLEADVLIELFDIAGKQVKESLQSRGIKGELFISSAGLSHGIYFVRFTSESGVRVLKIKI